jgi:mono/diheme cytochrome c family protein
MTSRRLATYCLVLAPFGASSSAAQPVAPMASHETGRVAYLEACATCHGPDGRGMPPSSVAFEEALPDFTDCRFATREPDPDWMAVAHGGGPARAFSTMMPAFGRALSEEQLQAILGHMRTFCGDAAWPRGELNLPRPLVTEKAFPEDEAVITTAFSTGGTGEVASKLVYERRVGARNQVELIVPFTFAEQPGEWWGGVGDVAFGAKRALYHDLDRGSIFSVAGEIVLPTGDRARGFGKGTVVFEPFVSFGQVLPADGFVQAQAGLELPADTDRAGREAFWRIAAGRTFSENRWGRAWSPMVELVAARELESGAATLWDVVPQMQVTLSRRQHIMASAGVRVPINDTAGRPTQLLVYFLWDWFDGPLFGGWR